jgi:hypothetical protein
MRGVFTNIARYDLALNGSTRKREKMNKVETRQKYVTWAISLLLEFNIPLEKTKLSVKRREITQAKSGTRHLLYSTRSLVASLPC